MMVKKQLESSAIQNGACIYCGQIMQFETSGMARGEHLNEWATEKCECEEGRSYERRKKSLAKAKEKIQQFFGQYQGDTGVSIIQILNTAADAVFQGHVEYITLKIDSQCKAKVSTNAKGNIKIERTDTRVKKYED